MSTNLRNIGIEPVPETSCVGLTNKPEAMVRVQLNIGVMNDLPVTKKIRIFFSYI
jgi:hypothetical protein